MERSIVGKKPTFHRSKKRLNTYRIMLWLLLIVGAAGLMTQVRGGNIKSPFDPTPTPTRMARSYLQEAEAYFAAGKIDDPNTKNDAIDTYMLALENDPNNADAWAQLARIKTYSSSLMTTKAQQTARLQDALANAEKSIQLNPDSGQNHAIYAFVLDWYAPYVPEDEKQKYLTKAMDESMRAIALNPEDGLALAFYAEVQLDQQKLSEAAQYAQKAVQMSPELMDTHRVHGTVLETLGAYRDAIDEYTAAAQINPNLTFLYIQIGVIYRHLALQSPDKANQTLLYTQALDYFDKAVKINDQLGVKDPLPYVAIAKTYSQMGEFYIASRNAERALALNSADANTYGQLGIIYFKAKNYESALPALQCAVESCTADQNIALKRLQEQNPNWNVPDSAVQGLPLESQEIAYYYAEYGQVMAYMSRPRHNYCDKVMTVMEQVRNSPLADSVLLQMVTESENICKNLNSEPVQ